MTDSEMPPTWEEWAKHQTIEVAEMEVVEGEVLDEEGQPDGLSLRIVPPPTNPTAVARQWMSELHSDGDTFLIRRHRNTFYQYDGRAWLEVEEARLSSELYAYLAVAVFDHPKEGLKPWEPTSRKMRDLVEALGALVYLDGSITPPAWIDDEDGPDVVPVRNGLLELSTRTLHPHTPGYFAHHVLPFDYDQDAPAPERWLMFLKELWPEDESSAEVLAEIFGYILAAGTEQQKIFGLIGPKRSGKGTIGRVLTGLLGAHNVAAPTLSSLATNFGMSPLIGKPLALISDARLGSRADSSIAVERLLSISGEDAITIDRKYRDPWTGRLSTRFVVLTNEIPKFADASGALASRFVLLVMTNTFYGREDPTLTDKLMAEAAGILNWALDGLGRLLERGYFTHPPSAREALRRLEDLSQPVASFVRDRCQVRPGLEVRKDELWTAWKSWASDEGRSTPGTKAIFYRDLHAAFPTIKEVRRRIEGSETRDRYIEGIGLRSPTDPELDDDVSEQQWTGPWPTPTQMDPGQGVAPGAPTQKPRSDGVGQDGPGSSALYRPQKPTLTQTPAQTDLLNGIPVATITALYEARKGNWIAIANAVNEEGHRRPDGEPWKAKPLFDAWQAEGGTY